ncbi:tRNA dihydrouridine synthase DusB [Marinobacterium sediminicola]|uniref:tRNA-dihydrouridine synthase B n=1 Tax=Marinobacterium sediminicola TaxID=518898 RepID=A0ABY1RZN9_9GAMM|nr:tRNA dihydrouridine synthase DusB [Marinobacterium sediminicola]ULG69944.1 tRNA dihydrouridine synthase DusB [Marinobacterium sediminicola]SMR74394.1 tRNA-U20-dihydrouridine synthase [Marinobacterium sediminicola]
MFRIGPYSIDSRVILAPMAGVTDRPFRQLCRRMGAGLVVSEMVTSDSRLWHTRKSSFRLDHTGEAEPRSIQIAGGDPEMMAEAARLNVTNGAQIIDINMGCPAKKVCNKAAGSALLRDEPLVKDILQAVIAAVEVPVTLKIRTGWCQETRNGVRIAEMAEAAGIAALAVHGRTRADRYQGEAEYDTIARIREAISIPLFANGDIDSPQKAAQVLEQTGADAVMIGRAAQGRPWLLGQIDHYLRTGELQPEPDLTTQHTILREHLHALHDFYGDYLGVRIARKHVGWYLQSCTDNRNFRQRFNQLETASDQVNAVDAFFAARHEAA